MAESQTVVILRAKRDAIAAAILNYERQLEQARADFTHVTAALSIFEADDQPGNQRAYVGLYRYFKYGLHYQKDIERRCGMPVSRGSKVGLISIVTFRTDVRAETCVKESFTTNS